MSKIVKFEKDGHVYKFRRFCVGISGIYDSAEKHGFWYGVYGLNPFRYPKFGVRIFSTDDVKAAYDFIDGLYAAQKAINTRQEFKECTEIIKKHGLGV